MEQFGLGRVKFRFPSRETEFAIWDMPLPPQLPDCQFFPDLSCFGPRFGTVDTRSCWGMSVFLCQQRSMGVYAHTSPKSSALEAFNRFSEMAGARKMVWVYVPFSRTDRIVAFGMRILQWKDKKYLDHPCYLLRMEHSGDVAIGPYIVDLGNVSEYHIKDYVFSTEPGPILVHPASYVDVQSILGAYPKLDTEAKPIKDRPPQSSVPFGRACYSSASLEDVRCAKAFRNEAGHCMGVLFEYRNGAQRALGQCRIGLDSVECCESPSRVRFRETWYYLSKSRPKCPAARVEFSPGFKNEDDDDDWTYHDMQGVLEFWFTAEEALVYWKSS
jgi:hypothetical protein